jgi:hypothetical protein
VLADGGAEKLAPVLEERQLSAVDRTALAVKDFGFREAGDGIRPEN